MKVELDNLAWIPKDAFERGELSELRRLLTAIPKNYQTGLPEDPIHCFLEDETHIGIGPSFAQERLGLEFDDFQEEGWEAHYPDYPTPRDEDQKSFFEGIVRKSEEGLPFLAKADTGFGKTVSGAYLIHHHQRRAIIIVTTKTLANQWKKEMVTHLGIKSKEVGIISGWDKAKYGPEIKVMIMVVNSAVSKRAPKDFPWNSFGVTIWDECHRMGAREFSKSLQRFASRVRMMEPPT